MARKSEPLKFEVLVMFNGDEKNLVKWDDLTEEKKEELKKGWSKRLSATMSAYYTNHIEEFQKLKGV